MKNLSIILIIFLAGCAVTKPNENKLPSLDTRSILAILKARYDLVDTMRAVVNFRMEADGKGSEVRGIMSYEKPDRLSIYAMGPFNEPKVVTLVTDKTLQIYFVAENELIKGELTDEALKEVFDIDLRISDIRSSIFADPFLDGNTNDIKLETRNDEYLIGRLSSDGAYREEISISAKDVTVRNWKIMDKSGKISQEIVFAKYKEAGGVLRPSKVTIYRPSLNTRFSIESVNPEINIKLSESVFSIDVPDSAKVYGLPEVKGSIQNTE